MTQLIQGAFTTELKSRYLTYALSTIMARALPDVRDGLKPVHRRLLYSMRNLHLDPDKAYKKCARVVGDVIGKYHPHGDQSVYDAMVRLAQDFAVRYPLVDGQGNFGSVDGDSAAAMRYTEARLTRVAEVLMDDLESGTVDFRANYDESEQEPVVFSGAFPNLLANGSSGIAVGMSTNIPPHNVAEICDALVAVLKKPDLTSERLLSYVQGPDFPTGGVIAETPEAVAQCYTTGRGSIRVRVKWETEDLGRGVYQIVITEIPYQVQKSKLVQDIADLINDKKMAWLADVRDESDKHIRIVLEPKSRTVDAAALMEALFRQTDLEVRMTFIMNALNTKGEPELMSLKRVLEEYLTHRRDVLVRKSNWRLGKIAERLHLLHAYQVVYLNLDEVIEIIKTNDEPSPVLQERFKLDKVQAESILNMRLRSLRKLEEMEIRRESETLRAEQKELKALLGSDELQSQALITQIKAIKKEFGDLRRTAIGNAPSAVVIPLEAQIEREPVTVLLSKQGWVKCMKGHSTDEVRYKEGDEELFRVFGQSTHNICVLCSSGRAFTLPIAKLPAGRGFGEPLRLMVDLAAEEEVVQVFVPDAPLYLVATRQGSGFLVESANLQAQVRTGKQVVVVDDGDKAAFCVPAKGDRVACYGSTKRLLVYTRDEIPTLQRGKGVRLMMLKDETLTDVAVFNSATGLGLKTENREKIFTDLAEWVGKRAQVGKVPPHGYQKDLRFFLPPEADVVEAAPALQDARVAELVSAITTPTEDDLDETPIPDLFGFTKKK